MRLAQQENCDLPGGCSTSDAYMNFTPHLDDMQNTDRLDQYPAASHRRCPPTNRRRRGSGASGRGNRMFRSRNGLLCVLNNVVPFVDTDLVSYSSYETINVPTNASSISN